MRLNLREVLALPFKPLVVYSPAVANGWSTNKELDNTTKVYGSYTVDNYGGIQGSPTVPMYQPWQNLSTFQL